jgi:hypothetical protein
MRHIMNFSEKVTIMDYSVILSIVSVWFVCAVLNTVWLRHHPGTIAYEFNSLLLILAPLATFIIAVSYVCMGFARLVSAAAAAIDSRR